LAFLCSIQASSVVVGAPKSWLVSAFMPVLIGEIYERWIGKYERCRLQALHDLKKAVEEKNHG
jgi:hypothetical protein